MTDIHDPKDLIRHLRPMIDFAADQAWAHAVKVGWDKAYPMLTADTSMPVTLEDLRRTYEGLAGRMYDSLQEKVNNHKERLEMLRRDLEFFEEFTNRDNPNDYDKLCLLRVTLREAEEYDPIHPADNVEILWNNYADFMGAVILSPNHNPMFKFGILW